MLIRSQNKQSLFNMDVIGGLGFDEYDTYKIYALTNGIEFLLGKYSTREKALKVLDMIEKNYSKPVICDVFSDNEKFIYSNQVFQMPQDDEVVL